MKVLLLAILLLTSYAHANDVQTVRCWTVDTSKTSTQTTCHHYGTQRSATGWVGPERIKFKPRKQKKPA